jgi:hypothetical protein
VLPQRLSSSKIKYLHKTQEKSPVPKVKGEMMCPVHCLASDLYQPRRMRRWEGEKHWRGSWMMKGSVEKRRKND